MEYLVILPFAPDYASGRELETAVRGWHRHFLTPDGFRLVVIGESCEVTDKLAADGLIEHIQRRTPWSNAGPEREFAAIAELVCDTFGNDYGGFIKTDDDIYPVNDFTLEAVKMIKWIGEPLRGTDKHPNHFIRAMYATQTALAEKGRPTLNYCSHAPRWYSCAWLRSVLAEYRCTEVPHLVEPLYFNCVYSGREPKVNVNMKGNPLKFGIYGPVTDATLAEVEAAIRSGVKWVNHSAPYYDESVLEIVNRF